MYFTTPITINHTKMQSPCYPKCVQYCRNFRNSNNIHKSRCPPYPPRCCPGPEVKLEQEEQEGEEKEEEGEVEEIEAESAASALLLLSKPKAEFEPSRFTSLWEGIFIIHNFLTALFVLCVLN